MNPRRHPVWAAVFGATYAKYLTIEPGQRLVEAIGAANTAVEQLLAHDKATRREREAAVGVPSENQGKVAVDTILNLLSAYHDYEVGTDSVRSHLLDIVAIFDPYVAERIEEGVDPATLRDDGVPP